MSKPNSVESDNGTSNAKSGARSISTQRADAEALEQIGPKVLPALIKFLEIQTYDD